MEENQKGKTVDPKSKNLGFSLLCPRQKRGRLIVETFKFRDLVAGLPIEAVFLSEAISIDSTKLFKVIAL